MNDSWFPPFVPHPLLRSGHAQTIAAVYFPGPQRPYEATQHRVTLPDGDVIVLHDDQPSGWSPGDRVVLMIHGLCGAYSSSYMVRVAAKLNRAGVRTFRMDLRRCGAGLGLARLPYHAGCSEDVAFALREIHRLCPDSPAGLIGFSMGGNIVLKLLGEFPDEVPNFVDRAVAANPPIDLMRSCQQLSRGLFRMYDRHFVRRLLAALDKNHELLADSQQPQFVRPPRRIIEFDDSYTAPMRGFGSAENYYARCSSQQFIPRIDRATLILTARDDPLIPAASFDSLPEMTAVRLLIAEHGGHLGYISKNGSDPDRRWMDWRAIDWMTAERLPTETRRCAVTRDLIDSNTLTHSHSQTSSG